MKVKKIAAVCALAASGVMAGAGAASAAGVADGLTSVGKVATGPLSSGSDLPLAGAGDRLPVNGLLGGMSLVGR